MFRSNNTHFAISETTYSNICFKVEPERNQNLLMISEKLLTDSCPPFSTISFFF